MLLYDSPPSGNCYKVRLLLSHLGIPYERRELSVTDRSNRPAILGGLNPSLRVPTIVLDDGRSLGDSAARQDDFDPLTGERHGCCLPDAGGGTRDDGDFALQSAVLKTHHRTP